MKYLAVLLIFCSAASGATWYVDDANGSDANAGTSWGAAWATIPYTWSAARAGNTIAEGDTVYFKDGDYGTFSELAVSEATVRRRSNWVTYNAHTGHSPGLTQITVNNLDNYDEEVEGSSYLIFDGFTISNVAVFRNTAKIKLQNCNIQKAAEVHEGYYAPYVPADGTAVRFQYDINDIWITGCTLHTCASGAIIEDTNGATISDNVFYNISEDSMHFGADISNIEVTDNYCHTWRKYSAPVTVGGTKSGTFVEGETVTQAGTGATGIVDNPTVSASRISVFETTSTHFAKAVDGGGTVTGASATIESVTVIDGVHTDGFSIQGTASDVTFRRNRIYGGQHNGLGTAQGIKCDSQSSQVISNITIENNVIYSISSSLYMDDVDGLIVNNNTLYDNPLSALDAPAVAGARFVCTHNNQTITEFYNNTINHLSFAGDASGYTNCVTAHGYNIFGSAAIGASGTCQFSVLGTEANLDDLDVFNAMFTDIDVNDYDFTLVEGSFAIDFGTDGYGPTADLLGNARVGDTDAGAYEYQEAGDANNIPPVFDEIGAQSVKENRVITFDVNATDDDGDSLTYGCSTPSGATFVSPTFTWGPNYRQSGVYSVTASVTDSNGWDYETFDITVTNAPQGLIIGN